MLLNDLPFVLMTSRKQGHHEKIFVMVLNSCQNPQDVSNIQNNKWGLNLLQDTCVGFTETKGFLATVVFFFFFLHSLTNHYSTFSSSIFQKNFFQVYILNNSKCIKSERHTQRTRVKWRYRLPPNKNRVSLVLYRKKLTFLSIFRIFCCVFLKVWTWKKLAWLKIQKKPMLCEQLQMTTQMSQFLCCPVNVTHRV